MHTWHGRIARLAVHVLNDFPAAANSDWTDARDNAEVRRGKTEVLPASRLVEDLQVGFGVGSEHCEIRGHCRTVPY